MLATLYAFPRYPYLDTALTKDSPTLLVIVGLVGVVLLGRLTRSASTGTLDRLDSVHYFLKHHRVVDVRPGL